MPISEKKKQSNKRWNDAHKAALYDQIAILCPKGERDTVKAAAAAAGISLSVYIMEAVRRRMESEQAAPWVSVTDRLPEGGEVLVYAPEVREVTVAFYETGRWIGRGYNEEHTVTHWQPLPAPPTVSGTPDSDTADGA